MPSNGIHVDKICACNLPSKIEFFNFFGTESVDPCLLKGHKIREKTVLRIILENYAHLRLENTINVALKRKREKSIHSNAFPHSTP